MQAIPHWSVQPKVCSRQATILTQSGTSWFPIGARRSCVRDTKTFYYEPDEDEELSTAVVTAVANAHNENVLTQEWLISEDINTDALDRLFQDHHLKMTLQFEADTTTATITADRDGKPVITIESHR